MTEVASPNVPLAPCRDLSPESVADLLAHFTIGAPATDDLARHRKTPKQQAKASPRLQGATKRRLPPNAAATQPSTRGAPPVTIGTPTPAVPTDTLFTFASTKTIDFSHPIPFPKYRAADPTFTPSPSAFPKAIQSLPPDVLIPVIRLAEPEALKSLSLVNRTLHYAIAPILYRSLSLTSLAHIVEFSKGFRHPLCVSSLQMFFTPDPKRPGWVPANEDWPRDLIKTLYSLERLLSFAIKRCSNVSISNIILSHSNNPSFLPSLQSLSFGSSHLFSRLALQRPIRRCGFTFQIKEPGDYETLKSLLRAVVSSGELLRELRLVINTPIDENRSKVLHAIGECAPGVRKLSVRFQLKGQKAVRYIHPRTLVRALPDFQHLTSLELFDTAQLDGDLLFNQITAAATLVEKCPNIRYVNFDGTLLKRSPPVSSFPPSKFPRLDWTPHPASVRGSSWWGDQSYLLEAKSQQQVMSLLKAWVLEYWGLENMWEVEPKALVWVGSGNS